MNSRSDCLVLAFRISFFTTESWRGTGGWEAGKIGAEGVGEAGEGGKRERNKYKMLNYIIDCYVRILSKTRTQQCFTILFHLHFVSSEALHKILYPSTKTFALALTSGKTINSFTLVTYGSSNRSWFAVFSSLYFCAPGGATCVVSSLYYCAAGEKPTDPKHHKLTHDYTIARR